MTIINRDPVTGKIARVHGMEGTPTYNSWISMISRCTKPSNPSYRWYGARGISVCGSWRTFANFLADMGVKPEGTSLDRIDSNRNYEPGNCRWLDSRGQHRNKRSNVLVAHDGLTMCLSAWAERFGLQQATVQQRYKAGWRPPELFLPNIQSLAIKKSWASPNRRPPRKRRPLPANVTN